MLDLATVKASAPSNVRGSVTQSLVDKLNSLSVNDEEARIFRESAIGYIDILSEGKFKTDDYINAIKYVSYVNLGSGVLQAWVKTFPDRYARLVANNVPEKTIASYASIYKRNQLVVMLLERMMTPIHVMNAPYLQEAINKQVDLMRNAKSERIQMEASATLIRELKAPETKKIELDMGASTSGAMDELRELTRTLAVKQQQLIEQGAYNAKDVAHQGLLIEGTADAE